MSIASGASFWPQAVRVKCGRLHGSRQIQMAAREISRRAAPTQGRGIVVLRVLAAVLGGATIALRMLGSYPLVASCVGSGTILIYAAREMLFKPKALSTGLIGGQLLLPGVHLHH